MSQSQQADSRRLAPAISAGSASFVVLTALFLATMLLHYRATDFAYLWFALGRILAISLLVAGMAALAARYLRSIVFAALVGSVAGFLGGVAYVAAAA